MHGTPLSSWKRGGANRTPNPTTNHHFQHWMEAALAGLAPSFPGRAVGLPSFSEELAHWLVAGADFLLVPSRFEPCGLVAQVGAGGGSL